MHGEKVIHNVIKHHLAKLFSYNTHISACAIAGIVNY